MIDVIHKIYVDGNDLTSLFAEVAIDSIRYSNRLQLHQPRKTKTHKYL